MKFYEVHQGVLTKTGTGDFYQLARFSKAEDAVEYFDLVKYDIRGVSKRKKLTTFIVELDTSDEAWEQLIDEYEVWTS